MSLRAFLLFLCLLLSGAAAAAQDFPRLTGRVVDNADLLDPAREAALTQRLEALEQQTGRQLVVATLPSLGGRTIEDYGYRLGRAWGIGDQEEDDGILLIVAPNERRVRIETGYGARVFLTDALSGVIIRNAITPRFKAGDYPGGIEAGVTEIAAQMQLPPAEAAKRVRDAEAAGATTASRSNEGAGFIPMIFWVLVIGFVLLSFARRAGGRRYRGKRRRGSGVDPVVVLWGLDVLGHAMRSGGGGGGFGGFGGGGGGGFSGGGGSFGGGGASGSW